MPELPTGTVTFLFTDIEGSTRLLQRVGDGYRGLLATHNQLLREAIATGGGVEVQTEGDGFFAVFPTATGAFRAAVQAQRAVSDHLWPEGEVIRVRMGIHTGEGVLSDGTYVGLDVHRAARIAAAGHGGQVLVSDATRALVGHALPNGCCPPRSRPPPLEGHRAAGASPPAAHRGLPRRLSARSAASMPASTICLRSEARSSVASMRCGRPRRFLNGRACSRSPGRAASARHDWR